MATPDTVVAGRELLVGGARLVHDGERMVRPAKKRRIVGNDTARSRLREFLDGHPDVQSRYTLTEVGREIGVSRQLAFALLPRWTQERQRLQAARVRAFARKHPKARSSKPSKRIAWPQIAAETGLPVTTVRRIWGEMGLRNEDVERIDVETIKRKRAERQRRRLATVLNVETCVVCGERFNWTTEHERALKYFGRSITCSRPCR
ncbi:MAG: hypothetical protein M3P30_09410, partial [Chloroflexota bacterium]|nr:hypothetical protein [Chloroflexota bacterium]